MDTTKGADMNATEIRKQAVALTEAQSTESLVEAFAKTDDLLASMEAQVDDGRASDLDFHAVYTARGFIIDTLDARGALDRVL